MLGIYKKKVADDEFLFIPKEPCPFVNAQGIVRCRSEAFFPDMSPVVVEGHMGDEGIYHIEKIAYPLSNKREASFFLNYLETKLPDSEKIKILNVMGNDIIPFVKRKDAEKILFEKNSLTILGFKDISKISPKFIEVIMNNYILEIFGDNLLCTYFSKNEISVEGIFMMVKRNEKI